MREVRGYGSQSWELSSRIVAPPAYRNMHVTCGGLVRAGDRTGDCGTRPACGRNLESPGTGYPRQPPLRRLAGSLDQCARPIGRCGLACTIECAYTEPGAAAERKLLRHYAGRLGRIKTRTLLQSHREVFGEHGQRYASGQLLSASPRYSHSPSGKRLKRTRKFQLGETRHLQERR